MKKIRFVFIAVVIALLLGSFFAAPPQKSLAAGAPKQSMNIAAVPAALSPFLFDASAQVFAAGAPSPENSTAGYSCTLMGQIPDDWTTMKSRQIFDTTWVLKNTGSKVWGIHGVDVRYRGDTRMHTKVPDLFDLPKKVGPGQKITLTLDMIAPKLPGYYVSNWGLYLGNQAFCKFYVIVVVGK